jgi:tRNA(fMet)-specific endonuclease VapC
VIRYILDTDICIYWLKGDKNIEKKILAKGLQKIAISVITECELFYGAFKSAKRDSNIEVIRALQKKVRTVHTSDDVSYLFGKLKSEIETSGRFLDDADLLTASIALSKNAVLVTNNTAHFKRIPDLKVENWR